MFPLFCLTPVYIDACVRVCVCVCVREREKEREVFARVDARGICTDWSLKINGSCTRGPFPRQYLPYRLKRGKGWSPGAVGAFEEECSRN